MQKVKQQCPISKELLQQTLWPSVHKTLCLQQSHRHERQGALSPLIGCFAHADKPVCHAQVTEVLECMTPLNCRLDLQSCAFEALQKEQKLLSASDVSVSTEPW